MRLLYGKITFFRSWILLVSVVNSIRCTKYQKWVYRPDRRCSDVPDGGSRYFPIKMSLVVVRVWIITAQ